MLAVILNSTPGDGADWISKTLLGAVIAALGYVGKLASDAWLEHQKIVRERRTQIVELRSLLRATKVSFDIQHQHVERLLSMSRGRNPNLDTSRGYDRTFADSFSSMVDEEKELHALIQSITVNSLKLGNSALTAWLDRDSFFKAQYGKPSALGALAAKLSELQTHLILWHAKFAMWIPEHPEHALVYMADEERHGSGFPDGLDAAVDKVSALL
jgi:hypothetical protein